MTFFLLRVFLVAFCGSFFLWLSLSVALSVVFSSCYPFLSAILPTCALQKCGFEAPYLGSLSTKLPLIGSSSLFTCPFIASNPFSTWDGHVDCELLHQAPTLAKERCTLCLKSQWQAGLHCLLAKAMKLVFPSR